MTNRYFCDLNVATLADDDGILKADGVVTVTWPMKADVSIDILVGPMTAYT